VADSSDRPVTPLRPRPPGAAFHPAGTSSGRTQSALLIPVPEAEAVVGPWRRRYDPVATAGVPAHITLIVPWIPPWKITADDLDDLAETLADVGPFEFDLTRPDWFGRRVLWLAPRPVQPFLALTQRLASRFGTPPWAGEFAEVVPHLTVAHAPGDPGALGPVAAALGERLPFRCRAEEVWVMSGDGTRWSVRAKVALDGTAPPG
jgi:2'-5' RNA ligase